MPGEVLRVDPRELPAGPRVVLAARGAGSARDRYVHHLAADAVPAGVELAAIVRCEGLSSPDTVEIVGTDRERLTVSVLLRRYSGALFVNTVTDALLEAVVGALAPGDHVVRVVETTAVFSNLDAPLHSDSEHVEEHRLAVRAVRP